MTYCNKCGAVLDNPKNCTNCGEPVGVIEEKNAVGFLFLGLCIPIIGIVLFFTRKNTKPRSAIMALVGGLINFFFVFMLGIIFAFAIPAVGQIIINSEKDILLNDARIIEQVAEMYCDEEICTDNQELTYEDIGDDIIGFDRSFYDFENDDVIAKKDNGRWKIYLERQGVGEYEFQQWFVPTECDRDCIIEDTN